MYFASNIKLLRNRRGRTQDDVANTLNMKRSTLGGYENQVAQPIVEVLLAFSEYYNIAIDTLIKVDLSQLSESQLSQLERGFDVFIKGSDIRVLTTTVGIDNEENIELVNQKASAGYSTGYADPEYIKILPTFRLPFLSKDRKYRNFQIQGDSMLPIPDGSYVTGEFVQNWNTIKNNQPYIILTYDEGIVFKIVENLIKKDAKLKLYSLNPIYEPFEIQIKDIREVWKFVNYISSEIPEPNLPRENLIETIKQLRKEVNAIQMKLNF